MSHPARDSIATGVQGYASAAERRQVMRGAFTRQFVPLVLIAAMGGCQTTQDTSPGLEQSRYQIAVEQPHKDTARALKYYEQLSNMKNTEFSGELDNRRRNFELDQSDLNRVQLAMLLSFAGTGFRDDAAAIKLLQPLARGKDGEDSSLRPLALLLHSGLADLHRADEIRQQQDARLKEEQRRADVLQNKLEALLELEMRMIEREQASQPKNR